MSAWLLPLLGGIALSGLSFFRIDSTLASVIPVPADYDGDGKVDTAIYQNGVWFLFIFPPFSSSPSMRTGWGVRHRTFRYRRTTTATVRQT